MKAKTKYYLSAACCVAMFLLHGCTIPSICHLYNGTGNLISMNITYNNQNSEAIELKQDQMKVITWPDIIAMTIDIQNKNKNTIESWHYTDLPYIAAEQWKWKGIIFKRHYFNAQLAPDGTIAILNENQEYPIRKDQGVMEVLPKSKKDVPNKALQPTGQSGMFLAWDAKNPPLHPAAELWR